MTVREMAGVCNGITLAYDYDPADDGRIVHLYWHNPTAQPCSVLVESRTTGFRRSLTVPAGETNDDQLRGNRQGWPRHDGYRLTITWPAP